MDECLDIIDEELNKKKKVWTRKWLLRRSTLGSSNVILKELYLEDPTEYRRCLRMTPQNFEVLLNLVSPLIQRSNTLMREALPARTKLEVTLYYLATGSNYGSLQHFFRVSKAAISHCIPEVCGAISSCLKNFMKVSKDNSIYFFFSLITLLFAH